jgi:hypothetical protein
MGRGVVSGFAEVVTARYDIASAVGYDGADRDFASPPGYLSLFDSQAHEFFIVVICH